MILSIVVALYLAYLISCCLYKLDCDGEMKERVVFPRIVYFIIAGVACTPILNLFGIVGYTFALLLCSDEYRVKSWLFEKPKQKGEEDKKKD